MAAAFNTPLAGIVFAIEEMGRSFEPRASGIILTAVILAGLITMAAFGNYDYFGTTAIHFRALGGSQLAAVLLTGVICGAFGALAARAMLAVSTGSRSRLLAWRGRQPMLFAAVCGVLIALIGIATHGESFGTGYNEAHRIVTGNAQGLEWFGIVKLFTMLVSQISGVTGGCWRRRSPSVPALATTSAACCRRCIRRRWRSWAWWVSLPVFRVRR